MSILLDIFYILSLLVIALGSLTLAYFPLAVLFELRPRREPMFNQKTPLVSIIVPAYNEQPMIRNCVLSILGSKYRRFEVILVNDGSKDNTLAEMMKFVNHPKVQVINKPNGGKASALNAGYTRSRGEVLMFVDSDGIFTPTTIQEMLSGFSGEKVGAVCGNDAPVNLDRLQTRLMNLQTHVGTGFVRRALAEINCLPIVSGNIGAFRRSALEKTFISKDNPVPHDLTALWQLRSKGPFLEGFIGEDLELTWRIHRAGYRVNFAPRAVVLAEVPSTIKDLWRQRVRWARGLLQTVRIHRDMFFNLKYGPLGLYLPINFFNNAIIPILQLLILLLVILLFITGYPPIGRNLLDFILWLGLGGALFAVFFAIILDRAWNDFAYLYVILLWVPYSVMMDLVMIWAMFLEVTQSTPKWEKLARTGVISRRSMYGEANKHKKR